MKPPPKPSPLRGPKTLTGSIEAKRIAAVVLEVLTGIRGTADGSQALGVSRPRYYQLETRALQGLITALEPRPRGRRARPEDEMGTLRRERDRLQRELQRSQALVRAAQRSIGIPVPDTRKKAAAGKTRRRLRRVLRATQAIAVLRQAGEAPARAADKAVAASRSEG